MGKQLMVWKMVKCIGLTGLVCQICTNFIQVQRGLGSSKLAISSVGGTVNFVTRATDKKGGFVSMGVANSDYFKSTAAYNTGIMKNGFGMSVMLSHWQGDGYNKVQEVKDKIILSLLVINQTTNIVLTS